MKRQRDQVDVLDVQLNVLVPADVKDALRHVSLDRRIPLRDLVREILGEWVTHHPRRPNEGPD
jgi:hypothetical protein